jgi:hypothetical protein
MRLGKEECEHSRTRKPNEILIRVVVSRTVIEKEGVLTGNKNTLDSMCKMVSLGGLFG